MGNCLSLSPNKTLIVAAKTQTMTENSSVVSTASEVSAVDAYLSYPEPISHEFVVDELSSCPLVSLCFDVNSKSVVIVNGATGIAMLSIVQDTARVGKPSIKNFAVSTPDGRKVGTVCCRHGKGGKSSMEMGRYYALCNKTVMDIRLGYKKQQISICQVDLSTHTISSIQRGVDSLMVYTFVGINRHLISL